MATTPRPAAAALAVAVAVLTAGCGSGDPAPPTTTTSATTSTSTSTSSTSSSESTTSSGSSTTTDPGILEREAAAALALRYEKTIWKLAKDPQSSLRVLDDLAAGERLKAARDSLIRSRVSGQKGVGTRTYTVTRVTTHRSGQEWRVEVCADTSASHFVDINGDPVSSVGSPKVTTTTWTVTKLAPGLRVTGVAASTEGCR